jgi:hypothetical protein
VNQNEQERITEDMRKIMVAVHEAREMKTPCTLKIEFSDNGGLMTIILESKRRYK